MSSHLDLDYMPCDCPGQDHGHILWSGHPHWPGERFVVRFAQALLQTSLGCAPSQSQMIQVIVSIVGSLRIAETMLDNALNFGTVKKNAHGRIVVGEDIPTRLLSDS